jgi:hypothetical protein
MSQSYILLAQELDRFRGIIGRPAAREEEKDRIIRKLVRASAAKRGGTAEPSSQTARISVHEHGAGVDMLNPYEWV